MLKRIVAAIGMVGMAFSLQAQSIPRSAADPSCSPRNYKHANKVAAGSEETHSVKAYNYRIQRELYTLRRTQSYKTTALVSRITRAGGVSLPGNAIERNFNPLLSRNFYKGVSHSGLRRPTVPEEAEAI